MYIPHPLVATDNCQVILSTSGAAFNGIYAQGDTSLILTASDSLHGNTVACQYTLSVVDMTPPVMSTFIIALLLKNITQY